MVGSACVARCASAPSLALRSHRNWGVPPPVPAQGWGQMAVRGGGGGDKGGSVAAWDLARQQGTRKLTVVHEGQRRLARGSLQPG